MGLLDPLSLEKSFRESFASVNGVLSAIAGRTAGGTIVDSSRVDAGTGGTGGTREVPVGRRERRSSSSSTGEALGAEVARVNTPPASHNPASLPPTKPVGQARQQREPARGGDGLPDVVFRLTTGEGGEGGKVGGGVAGGVGGAGAEDQMPADMSGMLQRYSEMMLRVVQVRRA